MNSALDPTNSLKQSRKFSSVGRSWANYRVEDKEMIIIPETYILCLWFKLDLLYKDKKLYFL